MTDEAMAARIAKDHKRLRVVSEVWCPRCTKRLAAVVVVDGETWLWTIGGRIGSAPGLLREVDELVEDAHHDACRADAQGQSELASHLRATAGRIDAIRARVRDSAGAGAGSVAGSGAGSVVVAVGGTATRVPSTFRLDDHEALVPCRGCRREVRIGPARPLR